MLGKGLESLIPPNKGNSGAAQPVTGWSPSHAHAPATLVPEEELPGPQEENLLRPIVVTKKEKEVPSGTEVEYELIAGERRLMAAKSLGLERIPAIIRHIDLERERLELAIIENLQRENLNGIEMARSFAQLQDE